MAGPHVTDSELRLVLVGRTGEGKSSTGNSLLGAKRFTVSRAASSVTKSCAMYKEDVSASGKPILVVDTPGLFDTEESNVETLLEITKCLILTSPGPHAFLLVMSSNRLTEELQETVRLLRECFGDDVLKHSIVVITGNDQLEADETDVQEFLNGAPNYVKEVLQACENRYVAFNNRAKGEENDKQVQNLLRMVDELVHKTVPQFFSSSRYREIERRLRGEEQQTGRSRDEIRTRTAQSSSVPILGGVGTLLGGLNFGPAGAAIGNILGSLVGKIVDLIMRAESRAE